LDKKASRLAELELKMAEPSFWNDQEGARKVIDEANAIKRWTEPVKSLTTRLNDLAELAELAEEEDEQSVTELEGDAAAVAKELDDLEMRHMLSGRDDHRNALLTIHPGAGGTESQDWAQMLARMYTRWLEMKGFQQSVLDLLPGEEAGIKSMTIEVQGEYAFGYLKAEKGIHRLVRISPFDANSRRHTSFASVFVYPEIENDVEVHIEEKDLRIDTYRSSGAGGQHVNKTSSAIRITHIPTGIVAQCQNERSQHRNKDSAMKILRARLYEHMMAAEQVERDAVEAEKTEIAWGNQIRSYVLHPYTLVKDHRTGYEKGDAGAVLEGEIDGFIQAYLQKFGGKD